MKFTNIRMIILALALLLTGCSEDNAVLLSLPEYTHKEFYSEGTWQDFSDYGVWTFASFDENKLEENLYFEKVTDTEGLRSYIENFEGWLTEGSELNKHYHFEKDWIGEGDYYFLYTKEGDPIGNRTYKKFEYYDVYIFDRDTWKLYYFHSNVS